MSLAHPALERKTRSGSRTEAEWGAKCGLQGWHVALVMCQGGWKPPARLACDMGFCHSVVADVFIDSARDETGATLAFKVRNSGLFNQ